VDVLQLVVGEDIEPQAAAAPAAGVDVSLHAHPLVVSEALYSVADDAGLGRGAL